MKVVTASWTTGTAIELLALGATLAALVRAEPSAE